MAGEASDLTGGQVQLLASHFAGQADRVAGIVSMLTEYAGAGGRSAWPIGR
ncbi:hypothetical protein SUDANB121_00308 [Nocardiopsis dassonvillei]